MAKTDGFHQPSMRLEDRHSSEQVAGTARAEMAAGLADSAVAAMVEAEEAAAGLVGGLVAGTCTRSCNLLLR